MKQWRVHGSYELRVTSCELNSNSKGKDKLPKPTGEPYPSCPNANEGSPLPQERSAKREESAPVVKAPAGNRKLTWPHVEAIRLLLRGGQSQRRVARLFNVSRGAISRIARGSTWKGKNRDEVMGAVSSGESRVSNDRQKGKEKGLEVGPSGKLKVKKAKDSPLPAEDGGIWLVTEPVQVPGVLLDIPCGMFRSREQAQAYLREQRERFQLRRIEGDWNRVSDDLRVLSGELKAKEKAVSSGETMQPIKGKEKA